MTKGPSAKSLLQRLFPPMLATLAEGPPPDESRWTYELKYDGFRAVAALTGGDLVLLSRNELDLAPRFPRVVDALAKLKAPEIVLDGEVVVLDARGTPRFQLLQQGEGRKEIYVVFDILWLDGRDLRSLPYSERRELLSRSLRKPPAGIELSKQIREAGAEALKRVAAEGWEGLIAKRNDSVYEPRRSKLWLKVKAQHEQELVIIGFNHSTASTKEIGALHLAVNDASGELRYAGKVGTGFSARQRVDLYTLLAKDVVAKPMANDVVKQRDAVWVTPRYVAQVHFTEWTDDNRLRHPAFLGMRDDKSPSEVVREEPMAATKTATKKVAARTTKKALPSPKRSTPGIASKKGPEKAAAKGPDAQSPVPAVVMTHPERVLYPRDGFTKEDVARYYAAVQEPMIAALRDRPLALEHWNEGIDRPSWFHQDVGRDAPSWVTTIDTPARTKSGSIRHLVVDRPETLQWLAQRSVLTTHMWSSRGSSLLEPDWLVFDLDPADGQGIQQAIEAAIIVRGLLEHMEIPSVPKTTGKRGIHVVVPLAPGYTHEEANAFACSISAAVAAQVPTLTMERSLSKRKGRLYLDCMQNAYGKTIVAPYSPRAIDGAPVSAPLKWSEITKRLDPLKYNIRTMPNRLAKVGDLFAPVLSGGIRLPNLS